MADVFIGLQSIYDRDVEIIGYELLYRSSDMNAAKFLDGDRATSTVIHNAFMEIGLQELVGDKLAFANLTRSFLLGENYIPLHQDQLVLEILEDITLDEELVAGLKRLNDAGYTLAADDVVKESDIEPIIDYIHIVKVDFLAMKRHTLGRQINYYHQKGLKVLAEKVETQADFDMCRMLGCDYFQGYFLSKPAVIRRQRVSSNKVTILRMLVELQKASLDFKRLADIILTDVTLSFKLLKLMNSPFYSRLMKVTSVQHALVLLGVDQVRSWANLLLLSEADDKPHALITLAMVRARMCENIHRSSGEKNLEEAFTVGLFSVLENVLDMPLAKILDQVPISPKVKIALLKGGGDFGEILRCVKAYELAKWDDVTYKALTVKQLRDAFVEATKWAEQVNQVIVVEEDENSDGEADADGASNPSDDSLGKNRR
ncbi:MAG: HDOD domain-containing protein [Zetaproteobacteria bacterium]|nr:HDOD domain-containing protein [Zetaproteobacteria bacterium]